MGRTLPGDVMGPVVLDRLLRPRDRDTGYVQPPCHPAAKLTALYERGGTLHLYCAECTALVLVVEIR